ncbi:MAG TPA: hypothetical protein DCM06_08845 [Comamonadaceae bacterium]|nr:hypothetical protein [Comamonadaceae bacterium]
MVWKLLVSDRCQSLSIEGTGSQTWVGPSGKAMSTRVVTSKLRQLPGSGAKRRRSGACAQAWPAGSEMALAAAVAAAQRRK